MAVLDNLDRLLFNCISSESEDELKAAVSRFSQDGPEVDWPKALGLGFRVFLPLYLKSKAFAAGLEVPGEIADQIKLRYINIVAKNEKFKRAIRELAEEFRKAEIDLIFLKGAALLATVYRDDIGLRSMTDIDALVRKKDLPRAKDILKRMGYHEDYARVSKEEGIDLTKDFFSKYHFHYIYYRGPVKLELHWDIVFRDKERTIKRLLGSCEEMNWEQTRIKILSPAGHILITGLDFIKDYAGITPCSWPDLKARESEVVYCTLFFLYEIKKIIKHYGSKISWDSLLDFCRFSENKSEFFSLLIFARRAAKADIPEFVLSRMRRNAANPLLMYLCRNIDDRDFIKLFLIKNFVISLTDYKIFLKKPLRSIHRTYGIVVNYLQLYRPGIFRRVDKLVAILVRKRRKR